MDGIPGSIVGVFSRRLGKRAAAPRPFDSIGYTAKMLKFLSSGSNEASIVWRRRLRQLATGSILCCLGCSSLWDPFLVCRCPDRGTSSSDMARSGGSDMTGSPPAMFGPSTTFQVGNRPGWIAVEDFDGDGKLDLAVANNGDTTVSVLMGKGDGTFSASQPFPVGKLPSSIAVGDFDGDCKLDLAIVNKEDNNVSVLLGQGDGTFLPKDQPVQAGPSALDVAVGDFNKDCKLDLVVANLGSTDGNGGVSVLLGTGYGNFDPHSLRTGPAPDSVAVGDFNGDGYDDIAVAANTNPSTVDVFLGDGHGAFMRPTQPQPILDLANPYSVHVADFNGDGKPDLVVADRGTAPDVSVLLGDGTGLFPTATHFPSTGKQPISIVVGDFNGDKKLDVAVAYAVGTDLSVLMGDGMGGLVDSNFTRTFGADFRLALGDFNRDGKPDLAVATHGVGSTSISILLNTSP